MSALLLLTAIAIPAQKAPAAPNSGPMVEVRKALSQAKSGDIKGALAAADALLARNPKYVPAIKLKAMLLEDSGQPEKAAEVYEAGLRLAPNDPDLLLKAGMYRLASHRYKESAAALSRCSRLLPKDGDVQYYLAQAYHLDGQDQLALAAMERAVKLEPGTPAILQKYGELLGHSGDYTAGLPWLLKARAADSSLPGIDYDIGLAEYKLMALPEAIEYLRRETNAHAENADAFALLATSHLRLNHWREAKDAYTRFLAIRPDDVESLLALGHCQLELHENEAAIQTLQRVLHLDPKQLNAHFYLARAFAALGDKKGAQRHAALHHLMMEKVTFVRTAETEQRESEIIPEARRLLASHRDAEAFALYQKQFQRATQADAYAFVGKTYLYMGQTQTGILELHRALELSPTVRGAHTSLGILALSNGDFETAEREFRAELAIDPNAQNATAEMGEVRYRQKRWAEAAEFFEKSKTMTPELLFMLTDTYFQLGKSEDACLNAELAATYGRENKPLMRELADLLTQRGQMDTAQLIRAEL